MLRLVVPGFVGHTRHRVLDEPFAEGVPEFFAYLRGERGLREETVALVDQMVELTRSRK